MFSIFFFKDSATTEIYTSGHTRPLHDALPIFTLGAARPDGEDWHNGQATGTWLHNLTVLLDNRNLKGQPGLWVATPLQLQDDPGHAVLVLRGWLERPIAGAPLPDLTPPAGEQPVRGTILHPVPRIFYLGPLKYGNGPCRQSRFRTV